MNHDIKIKAISFCVLATALTASWPAQADTIFLKCGTFNIFTVDLTNKTVQNIPASITPLSIDWQNTGGEFVVHFHIDRAAGTLTVEHHGQNFPPDTCAIVSQPPTKF